MIDIKKDVWVRGTEGDADGQMHRETRTVAGRVGGRDGLGRREDGTVKKEGQDWWLGRKGWCALD